MTQGTECKNNSERAAWVTKAKPSAEEEMRCSLSFRGSHLTYHSTESSSTTQQNIFVLLLCALSVYLLDRISNLKVSPQRSIFHTALQRCGAGDQMLV